MDSTHRENLMALGAVRVDGLEIRMNGTVQRVITAPKVTVPSYGNFKESYGVYVSEDGEVWLHNLEAAKFFTEAFPWTDFVWQGEEVAPPENILHASAIRLLVPNKLDEEIDTAGLLGRAARPQWSPKVFAASN